MKVVLKYNEVAERVEKNRSMGGEEIVGGDVVKEKRNENWIGLVVPGVSMKM